MPSLKDAFWREGVLEGWYTSEVILPDEDNEVVWLNPDGREVVGVYDGQGRWCTADGGQVCCPPRLWRYANADNPDTRTDEMFSRWMASRSLRYWPCDEGEV
jgi:hypothetical protein